MTKRILVMFSGEGMALQALINDLKNTKIVGVITDNPNANGIQRALVADIPTMVVKFDENDTKQSHGEKLLDIIDSYTQLDLIVLAGYMRVLSADFIVGCEHRGILVINIHPSLLPKYKGLHTHKRVLEAGDSHHGMTIHIVTPELDSGPSVFQFSFSIEPDDTEQTLEQKVKQLEQNYYPTIIDILVL